MNVVYREDPPFEVWLQLVKSAYATDLWSLGENDFFLLKKAFGRRFRMLVAYNEDSFIPIGCICSVSYRHHNRLCLSTVLGLFYVKKEFRGRGIGNELFRRMISDKTQQNLFLNGMSYMTEKYKIHYNFSFSNNWKALLYQISPLKVNLSILKVTGRVVPLEEEILSMVVEYDKKFLEDLDRNDYIRLFVSQDCADTWVALDNSNRVTGYGTARLLVNNEFFIGPLYADSPRVAISLLFSLLTGKFRGTYRNIQLQIPSTNEESKRIIEKMSGGFCTLEDYTIGQATRFRLKTDTDRIFSTTEYDFSFV